MKVFIISVYTLSVHNLRPACDPGFLQTSFCRSACGQEVVLGFDVYIFACLCTKPCDIINI